MSTNPIQRDLAGRGDEMQEYFVGINYFFYGHKLKWQNAIQYTEMDNLGTEVYEGWGYTRPSHQLVIQVFSCPILQNTKKLIMGNVTGTSLSSFTSWGGWESF